MLEGDCPKMAAPYFGAFTTVVSLSFTGARS